MVNLEYCTKVVLNNLPLVENKDFHELKRKLEEEVHTNVDNELWNKILKSSAEKVTNNIFSSIRKIESAVIIYDYLGENKVSSQIKDSLLRYYQSLM